MFIAGIGKIGYISPDIVVNRFVLSGVPQVGLAGDLLDGICHCQWDAVIDLDSGVAPIALWLRHGWPENILQPETYNVKCQTK